jgi:hypothetical protein
VGVSVFPNELRQLPDCLVPLYVRQYDPFCAFDMRFISLKLYPGNR